MIFSFRVTAGSQRGCGCLSVAKSILLAISVLTASCASIGNQRVANELGNKFQQCTVSQSVKSKCAMEFYTDLQRSLNPNDPIKPAYSKLAMQFHQLYLESEAGKIGSQAILQQRMMKIDYEFRNELQQVEQRERQKASDAWQKSLDDLKKVQNTPPSSPPPSPPPSYSCRRVGNFLNCDPN